MNCRLMSGTVGNCKETILRILQDNNLHLEGDGSLLLQYAVCLPNADIMESMLQKGANVNAQNLDGKSVLHRAVQKNNPNQVKLLLEHGADVSLKDAWGDTPIHYNFVKDEEESVVERNYILKLLLEQGANCNEANDYGDLALHNAVVYHNFYRAKLLLEYGADVSLKDKRGDTALHHLNRHYATPAEEEEQNLIIKLLLGKGACLYEPDGSGISPFFKLFQWGSLAKIKLLVDYGADVKEVNSDGNTALHFAVMSKDVDLIEFILDQGVDIECRNESDHTALHLSLINTCIEGCKILLRYGAEINDITSISSGGSLILQASYREPQIFRMLLEHGDNREANSMAERFKLNEEGRRELQKFLPFVMAQSKEMRSIITAHIAKMKYLGMNLNETEQEIANQVCNGAYYQEGLLELKELQKIKFYYNVSLFDLLIESKTIISGYARNTELVEALKKVDDRKFPIYFRSLKERFDAAAERQVLQYDVVGILEHLIKFKDPFNVINYKIVSYLRYADLKALRNQFNFMK